MTSSYYTNTYYKSMKSLRLKSLEFYSFDKNENEFHIELHDDLEGAFYEDLTKEQIIELVNFLSNELKNLK